MAKTPEAKVKAKVVAELKAIGAYYFYPVTGGYGAGGIPDIVGCYESKFFGIECKAGRNKPTALQLFQLELIDEAGGITFVVNEDNIGVVRLALTGE